MRILILGGDGMLGHQLLINLGAIHDVKVTLPRPLETYEDYQLFTPENAIGSVDVLDMACLEKVIKNVKPQLVVNAVGLVKQRNISTDILANLEVNATFPHRLAQICMSTQIKLIHISTDCVFSGKKGGYLETDFADANDTYGRTKYLGEVGGAGVLTLRTSLIGLELSRKSSLIEWFLRQSGEIRGFQKAIYSGFTTKELGRIIAMIATDFADLSGVLQVASNPISKYDLLSRLNELLERSDLTIIADNSFECDRSLDGTRFEKLTGYQTPDWSEMLVELADQIITRQAKTDSQNG